MGERLGKERKIYGSTYGEREGEIWASVHKG